MILVVVAMVVDCVEQRKKMLAVVGRTSARSASWSSRSLEDGSIQEVCGVSGMFYKTELRQDLLMCSRTEVSQPI